MKTQFIQVLGMVQGVGYRPFAARLCEELGLTGSVANNGGIVELTVTGEPSALDALARRLMEDAPPNARGGQIWREDRPLTQFDRVAIAPSQTSSPLPPLLPPDLPTCPRCAAELRDPDNRRYRYPFISCVSCGPRYSILERLPYDRPNVTMGDFSLCPDCQREYTALGDIRRHAQTIACHSCGPVLLLDTAQGRQQREEALQAGISLLQKGGIVAVKDIGGYHLACLPGDETACLRLRQLKGREKKPFAVLFADIEQIRAYCVLSQEETDLLNSNPRPIVLLHKRPEKDFAPACCGESREIGAMLPCNPLQILLAEACGPLVMTSANRSGAPMVIDDGEMLSWLRQGLDGVLWHRRRILTPLDDSVTRVVVGAPQLFRRARGYVPEPVSVPSAGGQVIFAAGGDLKACFCLLQGERAYLSQHFGDLEDVDACDTRQKEIRRMERLTGLWPTLAAVDLHPAYLSRQGLEGLPVVEVQHHHAHAASVMAEWNLTGPVLGVAFDGTGYGTDEAVWGSEFLLCQGAEYQRVGHLDYVTLLGGDEGARNADTILCGYLRQAGLSRPDSRFRAVSAALDNGLNAVRSSSMGRLFDAAAALLGICSYNGYEGECAIALENAAAGVSTCPALAVPLREEKGRLLGDAAGLIAQLWDKKRGGEDPAALALAFHRALVDYVVQTACWVRVRFGVEQVALSGGTFQNRLLLEGARQALEAQGFAVYWNQKVPSGDGGLCLGQAWVAARREAPAVSC
ncbi:MAG: carbamoyltransferase HypF [Clostridiales bacterium]|nr:carbamoyltransferase HypF [Clostridiales bacterium]